MEKVNIAEARARLEELIDRAAAGETILIARADGGAVRLEAVVAEAVQAPKFDAEKLRAWLEKQPMDLRDPEVIDAELRSLDRY